MHSCDLLIEALNKYEGTIILVSHDRYFVSKTANKIWEIVDHEIKEFKGGYEEYVAWKERMAKAQKAEAGNQKTEGKKTEAKILKSEKSNSHVILNKPAAVAPQQGSGPINKEVKKELQKQQKIFQQLEEKIATLNKEKKALEASLIDPSTYSDKAKFLQAETAFKKAEQELALLNRQYEEAFEKIMKLENNP
jgi:ATP-binding cassette subfamily F protein 3